MKFAVLKLNLELPLQTYKAVETMSDGTTNSPPNTLNKAKKENTLLSWKSVK